MPRPQHPPCAPARAEGNFSLEGLLARGLAGSRAGVVGTGRIGARVARLLAAFDCDVVVTDPVIDRQVVEAGARYVDRDELLSTSDIVALTCPLTVDTHHMLDAAAIAQTKRGVMIVNTGRGALIDAGAVVAGLKSGQIGSLALDVYEEESSLFFEDRSAEIIADDVYARLASSAGREKKPWCAVRSTLGKVMIADTLSNLDDIAQNRGSPNAV